MVLQRLTLSLYCTQIKTTSEVEEILVKYGIRSVSMPGNAVHVDHAMNSSATLQSEVVKRLAKDFVDWSLLTKVGLPNGYMVAT